MAQPRRPDHQPRPRPSVRGTLTVTRSSDDLAGYDGVHDHADAVWVASAEQLRFAVTAQNQQPRRTLSVFGLDAGDLRDRLLDRAGLRGSAACRSAGTCRLVGPTGRCSAGRWCAGATT